MLITQKSFTDEQLNIIKNLAKECGIMDETAKILYGRGYTDKGSINAFLHPSLSDLHSPYGLANMDVVVKRLIDAKERGETVVIYGDYDADGITSTALLYNALLEFGIDAVTVVPERDNGYGLSTQIIDEIIDNYFPDLLITVDCGVSNASEVEYLKDLGVDVIVTDHHEIPSELPACPIINCKLKGQDYPFDSLSGAGVAYKLATALIGESANKYLDLVAISTVADNMPLIGENRVLVKFGIEQIKNGEACKPIKTLISLINLKEITAGSIAFGIAPRINAGGRMGDAYSSLKFLLSKSLMEIDGLANKLMKYNVERQAECDKLYLEAKQALNKKGNYGNVIVLANADWYGGVLGILASRLTEEYNVPSIIFSKSGENYHGSVRSVGSINIYNHLKACSSIVEGFGGHAQAAGVTIKEENIDEFARLLSEDISKNTTPSDFDRKIEIDGEIFDSLPKKFVNELALFEPTGIANKKPIFIKTVNSVNAKVIKNAHLSFTCDGIDFMYFGGLNDLTALQLSSKKTLIIEPAISPYNGREYVKAYVKSVIGVELDEYSLYSNAFKNALLSACDSEGEFSKISFSEGKELLTKASNVGFRTLFVINNPQNIDKFGDIALTKSYLELEEKNGKNTLLIGGIKRGERLDGYNLIVHLDKPLNAVSSGVKTLVVDEVDSFDFASLKADRGVLVDVYKELVQIISRGAMDLISAYEKSNKTASLEQFLFAGAVFMELGFIKQGDVLYLDKTIKKELTSSVLFNKILKING